MDDTNLRLSLPQAVVVTRLATTAPVNNHRRVGENSPLGCDTLRRHVRCFFWTNFDGGRTVRPPSRGLFWRLLMRRCLVQRIIRYAAVAVAGVSFMGIGSCDLRSDTCVASFDTAGNRLLDCPPLIDWLSGR